MEASFSCKDDDSNSSSSGGSRGGGHFMSEQEESPSVPPEYYPGAPLLSSFSSADPTSVSQLSPTGAASTRATATTSSPTPKRSGRRSVQKRVVSIPIAEADGSRSKGCGEGAPPLDSWAWRKYGQKPIKGSPYPRGYYRCSSSKGCPARKQVERSCVDPNMLVITYACEHNHPWPLPKNNHNHQQQNHHQQQQQQKQQRSPAAARSPPRPSQPEQKPNASMITGPPVSSSPASLDLENSFAADLLVEEPSLVMMADEFGWFSDVSASSPPLLGSPMMPTVVEDDVELSGVDTTGDEESSLFAGLGELPECTMVFRRLRMQMAAPENRRAVAAAPCCGTTV